jgi:hypothetical protein
MHALSLAEWILRRVTSKDRAASIVGDLLEASAGKGRVWFWLSLSRVVLAHAWRRPVAFLAAFYSGNRVFEFLMMAAFGVHAAHRPSASWEPFFDLLGPAGTLLWIVAIYASIRFGLRSTFVHLAWLATGFVTLVNCYWWQPAIIAVSTAIGVSLVWLSFAGRARLRAALALLCVLISGFAGGLGSLYLADRYQKLIVPGLVGTRELHQHPSISWVGFFAWVLATWITTSACSILHRWATRQPMLNLESGGGSAA